MYFSFNFTTHCISPLVQNSYDNLPPPFPFIWGHFFLPNHLVFIPDHLLLFGQVAAFPGHTVLTVAVQLRFRTVCQVIFKTTFHSLVTCIIAVRIVCLRAGRKHSHSLFEAEVTIPLFSFTGKDQGMMYFSLPTETKKRTHSWNSFTTASGSQYRLK